MKSDALSIIVDRLSIDSANSYMLTGKHGGSKMHWVMCTNSDGKQILVNLFQVVSMSRAGNHTVLTYAGGEGCAVVVTEEPRDILVKTRLG